MADVGIRSKDTIALIIALVLIMGVAVVLVQETSTLALATAHQPAPTHSNPSASPGPGLNPSFDSAIVVGSTDYSTNSMLSLIDLDTFDVKNIQVNVAPEYFKGVKIHRGKEKIHAYVRSEGYYNGDYHASLHVIDLKTGAYIKKMWSGKHISSFKETPNGKYLFLTDGLGGVHVFNTGSEELVTTIQLNPINVTYDPYMKVDFSYDSKWAYVLEVNGIRVSVIDIETFTKVKELATNSPVIVNIGSSTFGLEAHGTDFYWTNTHTSDYYNCGLQYGDAITTTTGEYLPSIPCPTDTELSDLGPYFSGFIAISSSEIFGQDPGNLELVNASGAAPTNHCTFSTPNGTAGKNYIAGGLSFTPDSQYLYYVIWNAKPHQVVAVYTANCTITGIAFPQNQNLGLGGGGVVTLDGKYYAFTIKEYPPTESSSIAFLNTATSQIDKTIQLPLPLPTAIALVGGEAQ
ncbi:MAG: hypothetical protein HY393_02945 [Candidatus Diapherotrites archaeon]|nr:hypothetical protein [Candidatus Diapherotrites archaeon]